MNSKLQDNEDNEMFRVEWICFSCGRTLKNRFALYAHLKHCYWNSVFKDRIEEAPFYKRRSSKQLRYYYAHKPKILKKRKERRDREKKIGVGKLTNAGIRSRGKIRLPKTLG
jgi:hypothetical protein